MTRSIGEALPGEIADLLDGRALAGREGLTILLITTAADGWPHVAMLSAGEVLAAGEREVRLALWPGSATTANLSRTGQGLLMLVTGGVTNYVRLEARPGSELALASGPRAFFVADVAEVLQDVVGYAEITSAIGFRLKEPEKVVPLWEEAVAAMRSAPRPA
jgi:hypothetical protein